MSTKLADQDTPTNSLPDWKDCNLRVSNSNYVEARIASGGYGFDDDGHYANELHKFIYEYDCENEYKSAWWRHRLEMMIEFVKAEAVDEYKAKHDTKE